MWNKAALKDIKAGDKVIIYPTWGDKHVGEVERVTKTQIIVKKEGKFRKSDGSAVGNDKWDRTFIQATTQEELDKLYADRMKKKQVSYIQGIVRDRDFQFMPAEVINDIYFILKKQEENVSNEKDK